MSKSADPVQKRIWLARRAFIQHMMEPEAVYLGRREYVELRQDVAPNEALQLSSDKTFMGMRVYEVAEESHLRVVGEELLLRYEPRGFNFNDIR